MMITLVLHLRDVLPVDDTLCLCEQGCVQCDHIRGGEQRIKVDILTGLTFQGRITVGVIGKDLHSQCLGDPSGGLADPAVPDDTHVLAGKLNQGVVPETPLTAALPAAPDGQPYHGDPRGGRSQAAGR